MPRLTQQLPRYCKHKASGQAVVKFGGKLHYLGVYGSKKSKAEYQRIVGEWLTADRNPPPGGADGGDLTVVELLARYMLFAGVRPSAPVAAYRSIRRKPLIRPVSVV
jgi:hypothetical protein